MTLFRSLRERLTEDIWSDIVEVPIQCAVSLSYFIEERARRWRRALTLFAAALLGAGAGCSASGGTQPEMMRALGADAQAGRKVLVIDDLRAGRALHPETLGNAAFLVRRLYGLAHLLEPGHG